MYLFLKTSDVPVNYFFLADSKDLEDYASEGHNIDLDRANLAEISEEVTGYFSSIDRFEFFDDKSFELFSIQEFLIFTSNFFEVVTPSRDYISSEEVHH